MDTIVALSSLLQGDESITYSPFSSDISFFYNHLLFSKKKEEEEDCYLLPVVSIVDLLFGSIYQVVM
jgi:hypothetical protein